MAIPNPDQNVMNKVQSTFNWDGNPGKIKRKQLCNNFTKGGLWMIDLEKFICWLEIHLEKTFANTKTLSVVQVVSL